jgi:membrane-associated phospholipid phosphatase
MRNDPLDNMAEWPPVLRKAKQVAPSWMWDTLWMAVLSCLGIFLEFQDPFEQYLVPALLPRLSYPYTPNSVPTWALPVFGIVVPLGIIWIMFQVHRDGLEARRAAAGLCLSVAMAYAVTNALKISVGAFRPDFAARCWPDGDVTWSAPGIPACRPLTPRTVAEGRKSFPSGHTSMAFSGLGYLSIYMTARLRVFAAPDPVDASMWRMALSWAPLVFAVSVGISRVRDYWHHWEDVLAGAALGLGAAAVAFAQKKPVMYLGGCFGGGGGGDGGGSGYERLGGEKVKGDRQRGRERERGGSDVSPGASDGYGGVAAQGSVGGHLNRMGSGHTSAFFLIGAM